jgi:ubiquinone/menaquinone biosynthesis C-methylase UbiE
MTALTEQLRDKFYGNDVHPYQHFELEVAAALKPGDTLLDGGCGRTAPVLVKFRGKAARLIGVDLVDFTTEVEGVELMKGDLSTIPLPDESVDVIMARSVMEHVTDPLAVYTELARVVRPGGRFIFLTANLWDYAALIAKSIPNRLHPWIVSKTEGRAEEDVFPTAYKTNTKAAVERWAEATGFEVASFEYLSQYPNYFMFSAPLFLLATGYEKVIRRVDALKFLRGWIFVVLEKKR